MIESLITDSVKLTHALARGLIPVGVESEGLMNALKDLASNVESMFNVRCVFQCDHPVLIEDKLVATHLYRIAQEAITNAVKHGKAENIRIGLVPQDGCLSLTVENDGLELSSGLTRPGGMGLKIMRYRAEIINGSLDISKGTDGGTIVTCVFPNNKHYE